MSDFPRAVALVSAFISSAEDRKAELDGARETHRIIGELIDTSAPCGGTDVS